MARLTFHGGVNEIGGNKILLEDGKTRVFFDFGQSFNFGAKYFTDWLQPRGINGLGDYFEFDLLPKIEGLYAEEQLKHTNMKYVGKRFDAVFISHAHFDHVEHLRFLDPAIPVHLGAGTKLLLECMEETSAQCCYGEHEYKTFRSGNRIRVGDIVVKPIHVDHSIPGAYGFIIETSSGTVVYTGDLRAHGPRKDMTEEFIAKARKSEPVALICEGTRMVEQERRKNYSERQVEDLSGGIVSSTDKIVFVTRYSRDMDRFRSFYNVAKRSGRKLVISPKSAYLLSRLKEDKHLDLPDPMEKEDILIYYKRKKTGKFEEGDYYVWEREFMDKRVTYEDLRKRQGEIVMDLDFYQFAELIDIRPESGGHFIRSMSEPFSEEDVEEEVMRNWLDHFGLQFHQLHASGHINREQLTKVIGEVKPKKIFPVHTENPHLFKRISGNVQEMQCGKEYVL